MMYRSQSPAARKGIILLVVLALLTLFAVAGLAFVFYAQSRADSARVYRESQLQSLSSGPDTPPEILFDDWLRQFIFDVPDNGTSNFWNSAMRGHSLARTMYGGMPAPYASAAPTISKAPYSGTGRLHTTSSGTGAGGTDDYPLVNYILWSGDTRDPEVFGGARANFSTSYTYPDMSNMFLAAVRADGTVISPSYHRKWSFNPSNNLNDVSNPNWTNAQGKYMILRPRPQDNGAGFPYPTDATGDISNLGGGSNDSIWMDIGSPVKALPDGTLYKPLYAALVVDLDGRINLNVAGNIKGGGTTQVSNMGMGPWEMNLSSVLSVDATEWPKLFLGNGTNNGRYGPDGKPNVNTFTNNSTVNLTPTGNAAVGGLLYNFYDYDGGNESGGGRSGPIVLPSGVGVCFPSKPTGYGNGSAAELTNHPQLFNVFWAGGDDVVFSVASMKSLLYNGPTGSTIATSTLGKLCPNNFVNGGAASTRARNLVTTISFDLDQPGITPWLNGTQPYILTAPAVFPTGAAQPFPGVTTVTGGTANSEFNAGGQAAEVSATPKIGRIDLNRKLTDYPTPQTDGRFLASDMTTFTQAQQDRIDLAADIYARLVYVTGVFNQFSNPGSPTQQDIDALRYLAQLAVNMVDYIDTDEYMTPFNWVNATPKNPAMTTQGSFPAAATALDTIGKGWVFGTEMPRLVLNETYAEIDNDTGDLNGVNTFYLNFYVELYNPTIQDPGRWNNGAAMLQMGQGTAANPNPWAVHQVVVTKPNTKMRDLNNVFGQPDGQTLLTVADYTADPNANPTVAGGVVGGSGAVGGTNSVAVTPAPVGGPYNGTSGQNSIMCVIGPGSQVKNATQNTGPSIPYTIPVKLQTSATTQYTDSYTSTAYDSGMSYKLTRAQYEGAASPCRTTPGTYSILLRRLACPNLPPQTNANNPNYNPYITVDYVDSVQAFDNGTKDNSVAITPATPLANRTSFAKKQPYASVSTEWAAETAAVGGQPKNTFFSQNTASNTLGTFNWLTHLDRPLTSPVEALQVCGFKPHELTQQFVNTTAANQVDASTAPNYQHRAPWNNASARIYRVFEFLETKSRLPGAQLGGRIPGKININTIWDIDTFRALCDAQSSNSASFTAADVDNVYNTMVTQRTPGGATLSSTDQPFLGMAAGNISAGDTQYPSGSGVQNTLLAPGAGGKLMFESPSGVSTHPYLRAMLLNKIYNNVTTRSNVFGVWLTVGFFNVTNNTTTPPQLGPETLLAQGQNVRHHMFAIVDRSTLGIQGTQIASGQGAVTSSGTNTVTVATMPAQIYPGAVLMIDDAPNQESVVVRSVPTATTFTATFNKTHTAGFKIYQITPGNPGPQPTFGAKDSPALVPFYSIID